MFECTKCKIEQETVNFHIRNSLKRGHDSWCKTCKSVYRKEYFQKNKDKEVKRGRVKAWKTYNIDISYEKYEEMYLSCAGKCQICSKQSETLDVDHNHTTGNIRGLLCGSCNRGIGLLKESI